MTEPKTCTRDGCTNPLGYRQVRFCSAECLRAGTARPVPVCAMDGCDNPAKRGLRRYTKYCSDACARPHMRGMCAKGLHPKPNEGRCKLCQDANRERYEAGRRKGPRQPKPKPAPPPVIPVVPRGPVVVWRPAGLDRYAARCGPGDPAPRRGLGGVTDSAPRGDVDADATVDPESERRSA